MTTHERSKFVPLVLAATVVCTTTPVQGRQPADSTSMSGHAIGAGRTVVLWGPDQILNVREAYQGNDPRVRELIDQAAVLAEESRNASPRPQRVINLRTGIGVAAAKRDAVLTHAFGIDYVFNGNGRSRQKARQFLLAWARTYDTDEYDNGFFTSVSLLVPFIWPFELVRGAMPANEVNEIHSFWRAVYQLAEKNLEHIGNAHAYTNPFSYHVYTATAIGFLLNDPEVLTRAESLYNEQIDWNLFPGGTPRAFYGHAPKGRELLARLQRCGVATRDFERSTLDWINRDALGYHIISIRLLLWAGWFAENNGRSWLSRVGQQGMKLADGFDLLTDYVDQRHTEFEETCNQSDEVKDNKSWVKQPDDVIRALACGALLDKRFVSWHGTQYGSLCTTLEVTGR
ncbi:MAG: alginate lyase family protein [Acidobacteria bacterium]|nr:alginate lyase family protein [Acidobacteriota bacterium]